MTKLIWRYVYRQLIKCGMFSGKYDALYGDVNFMYGIQTVIENIAIRAGEKYYNEYNDTFIKNILESEKTMVKEIKKIFCPVCETEHDVEFVEEPCTVMCKGKPVTYLSEFCRCGVTDVCFETGEQRNRNLSKFRRA